MFSWDFPVSVIHQIVCVCVRSVKESERACVCARTRAVLMNAFVYSHPSKLCGIYMYVHVLCLLNRESQTVICSSLLMNSVSFPSSIMSKMCARETEP